MNPNFKKTYLTNLLLFFILLIFTFIQLNTSAFCSENNQESSIDVQTSPRVSFGIGGLFGFSDVNHISGNDMKWKPGYLYGGGLIFESMFTNTFGLHSGLWYSHYKIKAKFPDEKSNDVMIDREIISDLITMPFYLITSLSSRTIGFNLLSGLSFSYIMKSRMEPGPDGQKSQNIQKFLGAGQIGAGGGFEFLFKTTTFTRIFITITGEYFFKNLIDDNKDSSIDHSYNATVRTGLMLCTF